ncbi:MAG TPA: LysM peptidoglycan-binding domain-containing protein [Kineosporiaceae bacterium]|nr:LysM peptidoglycan-binding domain-containing protein [Kineosporiaceae bacterium]
MTNPPRSAAGGVSRPGAGRDGARGASRSARGRRPAGAFAHGLLALAGLLALFVGIPLALLRIGSTTVPYGFPDLAEVVTALTSRDDGTLFLATLTAAAWAGWATFAGAVLLEIPAQIRGVPPVRVPGLGVQQSVAGGLVAAVLTVLLLPGAASANERHWSSRATSAVRTSAGEAASVGSGFVPSPAAAAAAPAPTRVGAAPGGSAPEPVLEYVVRRGDTLWDIAERALGDGARWREVAANNYDRVQPDGERLDRSHVLRPGWKVVLPPRGPIASTRGTNAHPHLVRPGETLSGIAEQELGAAQRYPELVAATADLDQPGGARLEDPDLIYPGWIVDVPFDAVTSPATSKERTGQGHGDRPATSAARTSSPTPGRQGEPRPGGSSTRRPAVPGSGEQWDPGWAEASSAPAVPSVRAATPVSRHDPAGVAPTAEASGHADGPDGFTDDMVDIRTIGGVGSLLAASIVLLLSARRSRQQRRRRPGRRLPIPEPEALHTEMQLRSVADRAGLAHVDLALRALAAHHRAAHRRLPGLRFGRLTRTDLELYLCEPARFPPPWAASSDPTVWAIAHEDLVAQAETDLRAPYPTLVTLGQDLEDAHVLVDLEQVAALSVDGPRDETLAVLAAMAVQLGTSPWADDLLVTLVACHAELPPAVASGRLRCVDQVGQLVTELGGRARDVERVLREAAAEDLATARGTGVADDTWAPEVVILAGDLPDPSREQLREIVDRIPRVGVAAVTGGGAPLGEWRLRLGGPDDTALLEPIGVTLRPQRLGGAEYESVLDVLRLADADSLPGPAWASGVDDLEPSLSDLPRADSAARGAGESGGSHDEPAEPADVVRLPGRPPLVRLFGAVEVVGALGPEPVTAKDGRAVSSHLGRATALVAYLACHPEGVTIEQLSEALSPVRRLAPSTVWSLTSRARKWLGSDPVGAAYLPRTSNAGSHRLHPAVRTDWARWLELVGDDVTATPLSRLSEALQLVRGRPFDGVAERHYAWAEPLRQEMIASVADVVHEVVRRALQLPDTRAARRAATLGRLIDPANERVWRDALRVEYVAGDRAAQRKLVEQLYVLADDLETDLEPETEKLIVELGQPAPRVAIR